MKPVISQGRKSHEQVVGWMGGSGRGWLGAVLPSGKSLELAGNTREQGGVLGLPSELSYPHLPLNMKDFPQLLFLIKPTPTHLPLPSVTSADLEND